MAITRLSFPLAIAIDNHVVEQIYCNIQGGSSREAVVAGCQGICLVIARSRVRCPAVASRYCCFLGQETLLPLPQPPSCKTGKYCLACQGTAEKQPKLMLSSPYKKKAYIHMYSLALKLKFCN